MRIKVTLMNHKDNMRIPINYNHSLTAVMYRVLGRTSMDYSIFLHNNGYMMGSKRFRLFTFSNLYFSAYKVCSDEIHFNKGEVNWFVSSPIREFVDNFAHSAMEHKVISIEGVKFDICSAEVLKEPNFNDEMKFTAVSPITVSASCTNGKHKPSHYIRYDENGFSEAIKDNLIKKHRLINGYDPDNAEFEIEFDSEYIKKKAGKIQKKIRYIDVDIIGFLAPFKVRGSENLIRVGYEAGFGEKGSMGFGMAKECA